MVGMDGVSRGAWSLLPPMFGPVHVFAFGTSGFLRACELHSTIVGPLETQPRLCSGSRSGKYKAFREDFASVKKYTQEMPFGESLEDWDMLGMGLAQWVQCPKTAWDRNSYMHLPHV